MWSLFDIYCNSIESIVSIYNFIFIPGLDENGRAELSQLDEPVNLSELGTTDGPVKIIAENKLEKWGLRAVFTGGPLALGSEVFTDNGVGNTITNTCLAVGTVIMIAGSVALILSERKKQLSTVQNDNGDELRF